MREVYTSGYAGGASRSKGGSAVASRLIDWLRFAAAPTFAVMAALTALMDAGRADIFCSAAQGAFAFSGMALMYALMSAFHAAPWLKLISTRAGGARRF